MSSERVVAFDALRVFAIVSVVAIHTLMPYRDQVAAGAIVGIVDDLLHYAVPLFVFISGVFTWGAAAGRPDTRFAPFIRRRIGLVGLPYAWWATVFLGVLLATEPEPIGASRILGLLLSGHVWYHLYFIPMLISFYLLTPAAVRIARRSPEALLIATYALRILAGPALANAFGDAFGQLAWQYATHILTHLPHMALGCWFALRQDRLPQWLKSAWPVWLALGTAVLGAASTGATTDLPIVLKRLVYPGGMAATLLGLVFGAMSLDAHAWGRRHVADMLQRTSALSFGVYFIHPLYLLAVNRLVERYGSLDMWRNAAFPLLVLVAVTVASFATSGMLASWGTGARLVGAPAPRRSSRGT